MSESEIGEARARIAQRAIGRLPKHAARVATLTTLPAQRKSKSRFFVSLMQMQLTHAARVATLTTQVRKENQKVVFLSV